MALATGVFATGDHGQYPPPTPDCTTTEHTKPWGDKPTKWTTSTIYTLSTTTSDCDEGPTTTVVTVPVSTTLCPVTESEAAGVSATGTWRDSVTFTQIPSTSYSESYPSHTRSHSHPSKPTGKPSGYPTRSSSYPFGASSTDAVPSFTLIPYPNSGISLTAVSTTSAAAGYPTTNAIGTGSTRTKTTSETTATATTTEVPVTAAAVANIHGASAAIAAAIFAIALV